MPGHMPESSDKFVNHRWVHPGTIEKRLYQEAILATAVRGNTLVVLPTALGKTAIAALVAAYRLDKDMSKKILIMAPTKPLVNQHRESFARFLRIGEDELKVVTGETKPEERSEQYRKADIVFATPQTIRNDLKSGILNLKNFSLLVVDEAHRCVKNYAYTSVARKYMHQAEKPLILALTASPGGHKYKIDEVKRALSIEFVEIRTREDMDVTPYIQETNTDWVTVELTKPLSDAKKLLESMKQESIDKLMKWNIIRHGRVSKTELLMLQQKLSQRKTGSSYAAMSLIAEIIKLDHALLLLETQCVYSLKKYLRKLEEEKTKASLRIASRESYKEARRIIDSVEQEHPKMQKLLEIVEKEMPERTIIFTQYRDTVDQIMSELRKVPEARATALIGQSKSGTEGARRGLNQKEQIRMINEFNLGFFNCLVCTSIGEEGLHIATAKAAVFYEPVPSAVRTIQRRGRVGREQTGRIYILVTKGTRDEAYYWVAHHGERKMTKTLKSMQKQTELKNWTADADDAGSEATTDEEEIL